jgi:hypothetical protein
MYDIISSDAYKKGPLKVEIVVNARTNDIMVSVVGLIPTNVVYNFSKCKQYNDQIKL